MRACSEGGEHRHRAARAGLQCSLLRFLPRAGLEDQTAAVLGEQGVEPALGGTVRAAFAVVGEEFGLIACLILMGLFSFVVVRILRRAAAQADPFPALAASGLAIVFGLQAVINMGVNVSLLPAKGMTLPFISYGGSSLIGMAFAMGLVLSLARRRSPVEISDPGWRLLPA